MIEEGGYIRSSIKLAKDNCQWKINTFNMMGWPSGLRRWFKAPVGNVVGSNPTLIKFFIFLFPLQLEFSPLLARQLSEIHESVQIRSDYPKQPPLPLKRS